jgi:mRNA interferase MazF
MVRGEILRLPMPRGARGHEQRGARFAVVVQADESLELSTVLVSPTSTSARPASFRPTITLDGAQNTGPNRADHGRRSTATRRSAGRLNADELRTVDEAVMLVLGL